MRTYKKLEDLLMNVIKNTNMKDVNTKKEGNGIITAT